MTNKHLKIWRKLAESDFGNLGAIFFLGLKVVNIFVNEAEFYTFCVYTIFRWKNTRFLRTINESYIFQWVLCHIGFSYPLFLQTWCSVICTGCICQESAIQLSSWQSFTKYRREIKKGNVYCTSLYFNLQAIHWIMCLCIRLQLVIFVRK